MCYRLAEFQSIASFAQTTSCGFDVFRQDHGRPLKLLNLKG
jgi:hypothetical protein